MAVQSFSLSGDVTRREYAIYAIVATPRKKGKVLVHLGNTGDFKRNCNPVICWAGNHFSYNVIHNHKTIKVASNPELYDYEFLYSVYDTWKDDDKGRERVELLNEMERELNRRLQDALKDSKKAELTNPHAGTGNINKAERLRREAFHNKKRDEQVVELLEEVLSALKKAGA